MVTATEPAKPAGLINADPYADVRMHAILHDGRQTDKFMVEMADEDGAWQPLPGVNSVHGADYTLVPNAQVHELVGDVLTRTGKVFKPVAELKGSASRATYWDGKKWTERWFCEDIAENMPNGHAVALGVEAVNSYDGSHNVGIRFFAMHMLCQNQFHLGNMLGNFVFRHMSRDAGIRLQDNVNDALQLMRQQAERFVQLVPRFKELCSKTVNGMQGFLQLRTELNEDGWRASRDPAVLDELHGCGITRAIGLKQLAAEPTCLWNILNAYTGVSTHVVGGLVGAAASERVTSRILKWAEAIPGA